MLTAKTSKRLQTTQAQLQEISYAQEVNQETSYAQAQLKETSDQTENTKNFVWVWTIDIQSVLFPIQIKYRLLKTLEFLRYEGW